MRYIYVNDVSQAHAGRINLHCINSYHAIYVITHRTHNLSRGQLILTNLHQKSSHIKKSCFTVILYNMLHPVYAIHICSITFS